MGFVLIRIREFLNVCLSFHHLLWLLYPKKSKTVFDKAVDSLISKFGILERNGCKGYFRKFTALIHLALANLYIFLRFILKL